MDLTGFGVGVFSFLAVLRLTLAEGGRYFSLRISLFIVLLLVLMMDLFLTSVLFYLIESL